VGITGPSRSSFSRRFVPGTPDFEAIKNEIWDMTGLAMPFPGPRRGRRSRSGNALPGRVPPENARREKAVRFKTRVQNNVSDRPFPAKACTAVVWSGSAHSCATRRAASSSATTPARGCPRTLKPGATLDVPIEIVAPKTPGNYVLKFDLVSEGIDWFENNGSPTTLKPLVVK
jgi:hypothetical protein